MSFCLVSQLACLPSFLPNFTPQFLPISVHALSAEPSAEGPDDWWVVPSQLPRASEGHRAGVLACSCPVLHGEDHAWRGVQRVQRGLFGLSIHFLPHCHSLRMTMTSLLCVLQMILQKEFHVIYALAHVCGQDRTLLASLLLKIFRHEKAEAPLLRTLNDREINMEGKKESMNNKQNCDVKTNRNHCWINGLAYLLPLELTNNVE